MEDNGSQNAKSLVAVIVIHEGISLSIGKKKKKLNHPLGVVGYGLIDLGLVWY